MEPVDRGVNAASATDSDKTWLQKLKHESWEAELLVAAVGIFGSFQLFSFIEWLANVFISVLPRHLYHFAYFITFSGLVAVSVLASMFVIHFMLRAYWVGLVGLNSVFSDYSTKDSLFSKSYTEKLTATLPKLEQSVVSADKLCSVIFAAAFYMLMMYSSIGLFGSLYLLGYHYLSAYISGTILVIPIALSASLMLFQGVFSLVANLPQFKENERVQHLYFRTIVWTSRLTFGPLYKPVLQIGMIFSSNFKRDPALVKLILFFIFCGFIVAGTKIPHSNTMYLFAQDRYFDSTEADSRFYLDKSQEQSFLLAPQLPSDVIEQPLIELFIPVYRSESRFYKQNCQTLVDAEDAEFIEVRKAYLDCYKQHHQILINGVTVEADIIKAAHPITGQFGIKAYVQIDGNLANGYHKIQVAKTIGEEDSQWLLPFYYVAY